MQDSTEIGKELIESAYWHKKLIVFTEAPKCDKGNPCGMACISKENECRNLLENNSDPAQLASQYVEAIVALGKNKQGPKKAGADLMEPGIAKKYLAYYDAGEPDIPAKREISNELLEQVWSGLPAKIRADFREKGQPCGRKGDDRLPQCDAKAENKEYWDGRGKAILKKMLGYNLTDPVTGEFFNWRRLQPDHKMPLSEGGKDFADDAGNLRIVQDKYNQQKLNGFTDKTYAELKRQATQSQADYEADLAKASQKNSAKSEREEAWRNNVQVLDKAGLLQIIDSAKADDLKAGMKAFGAGRLFVNSSRGVYGTVNTMKGLLKLKAGIELSAEEKSALKADGDKHEGKEQLHELIERKLGVSKDVTLKALQ